MKSVFSVCLCLFFLLNVNVLDAQEQQAPKVSLKDILKEDAQPKEQKHEDQQKSRTIKRRQNI